MELWQRQYVDELIISIKTGNPINFPEDLPVVDRRTLDLFRDEVRLLQAEYEKNKQSSLNKPFYLVAYTLQYLKKIKDEGISRKDAYEIYKRFYVELDFDETPPEMKKKFDDGVQFLEKKISYFCSYTTKGLPELNSNYEETVVGVFGVNKHKEEDKWKRINYVAKLIVRYLNNLGNHNYFFDRDKLVNGDEIKTQIYDYCERAAAFVILAQQETFNDIGVEQGEYNWCFAEYEQYKKSNTDRLLIVYKIPGISRPLVGDGRIREWFDYLSNPNAILNSEIAPDAKSAEIKLLVQKNAKEINDWYDKLFSNIVNA
jgi:hypothetical protein